jgi:hypothetical protein
MGNSNPGIPQAAKACRKGRASEVCTSCEAHHSTILRLFIHLFILLFVDHHSTILRLSIPPFFNFSSIHSSTIFRLFFSGPRPLPLQKRLRRAPPAPHPGKQSFHPKVVKTNTRDAGGTSGFPCILSAFYTLVLDAGLEGAASSYVGVC